MNICKQDVCGVTCSKTFEVVPGLCRSTCRCSARQGDLMKAQTTCTGRAGQRQGDGSACSANLRMLQGVCA